MKLLKKINWQKISIFCNRVSIILQALACCLLYFVIEAISRHSFVQAWDFMTSRPWVFLYNSFLIFTTSIIVYLFRRRTLVRVTIGALWLLLGIVNGVILANRVTPFTGPDLKLLSDATKIVNNYLSPALLVVVIILLIIGVFLLIWLGIKGPKFKGKIHWPVNIALVVVTALLFVGTTKLALEKRVLSNYFGNIAFAYQDYGFPYCLGVTIFDTGISEPNGYSEELMDNIIKSEGDHPDTQMEQQPNIVFLQLESFFDPEQVNFLNLSEDPIPIFRQLMKDYSSGYFRVPAVGAGTANTEFEAITGMSLHYFGPGEYPYKTILKQSTCESAPFVLKNLGYSTHAIHNNEANFYARKSIFPMLGFDSFTSEEYMPDISDTNENGWVKDHILTDEIVKAMDATDGPDYVYTISVQGHGDYPTEPILSNPEITVTGAENKEKNNYSWEYYVNQIHEMDNFIKELTDTLSKYPEPVVLVMYGDHLPTMGLETKDMENRYLFQTEYVMWDNFGLKKQDKNLSSYQVAAEVFNRIGIHDGTVLGFHQTRRNTKNYQVDLEALQYDLLYGKKYAYGGKSPYKKNPMTLGVLPITIDKVEKISDDTYSITGENFTASSRLEINDKMLEDTRPVSNTQFLIKDLDLKNGDKVDIAQQSNSSTRRVLSRSAAVIYQAPDAENDMTLPSKTPQATGTGDPDPSKEAHDTSEEPADETKMEDN
ncbi:sulfatase-like hydrolase/transferase [Blautia liquoris]|uniref:Sulfatase-like hydrolase/transferase n=1 Tax=Blautia liquoris TaxID=2779518 RepID=A0A7M2RHE5_9FIRM|nr:LTA synthase family protein [Blautia liquoris]QOV19745.1 sulfatase-like hydrolase/transferase [Blautia liquoris]